MPAKELQGPNCSRPVNWQPGPEAETVAESLKKSARVLVFALYSVHCVMQVDLAGAGPDLLGAAGPPRGVRAGSGGAAGRGPRTQAQSRQVVWSQG